MEEGKKFDGGKPRWDLLPIESLSGVVDVLTFGCNTKYGPWNWVKVKGWRWRYYRAAMTHVTKWWMGEAIDPETNCTHLQHAICCLMFLDHLTMQDAPDGDVDDTKPSMQASQPPLQVSHCAQEGQAEDPNCWMTWAQHYLVSLDPAITSEDMITFLRRTHQTGARPPRSHVAWVIRTAGAQGVPPYGV